jgi:hypothetical protein
MSNKIQQYSRNEKEINKNYNLEESRIEKIKDAKYKASNKWNDKIWGLEKKQREEEQRFDDKIKEAEEKYEEKREKLRKVIKNVDKTVWLLEQGKIDARKFDFKQVRAYKHYGDQYTIKLLDKIEEEHLKLGLFVVGNDRQVNKYNLVVVGYTPFTDGEQPDNAKGIDTFRMDYSHTTNCDWGDGKLRPDIQHDLKFFKTKENAIEYAKKGLRKILPETFKQFERVKKEYENVIANHKLEDFTKFRESKAVDQYANHYSDHDDTAKKHLVEEMKTIRPITITEAKQLIEKAHRRRDRI